jgi:hypothetical protein
MAEVDVTSKRGVRLRIFMGASRVVGCLVVVEIASQGGQARLGALGIPACLGKL